MRWTPGRKADGLGIECLHAGGSSGYMAVNLAYHLGASQICLLGFDMQATNGALHFHGNHKNTGNPNARMLAQWAGKFDQLGDDLKRMGVDLVNCTRETALTIPRKTLESVLHESG